jgi:DNA-directed RNA polymerase subunit RPC12/RpoP
MKVKEFLSDYSDHKISCLRYQTVAGAETSGYWKIGNRRVRFLRKPNGDYNIRCPQCGHWFYFGKKEQDFYARHGFDMPSRCHKCRGGQLGRI